jgi:hypothetical protein
MKKNASRLGIYADVREVADMALTHGGGSYDCGDINIARNFSHRFYRFRRLYGAVYHADGSSNPYDKLILPAPRDGTITFRVREPIGVFRPARGPRIASALTGEDELFEVAENLRRKLQGED